MGVPTAVIATGQTIHTSRRLDANIPEMVHEVIIRVLEDAEMTIEDIDAVVIGNMEHFEGINLSDQWALEGGGAYLKPQIKIATGGTTGSSLAACGYYHVASGMFDVVLVIGWEKQSEGDTTAGIITAFDPIFERPGLAGAVGGLAMMAAGYIEKYNVPQEQAAMAAVKARKNAQKNPYAHLQLELTVEDVMKSPMLSYPIKLLDMCPTSDGACAIIFAGESFVKKSPNKPAWVKAVVGRHNHSLISDIGTDEIFKLGRLKVGATLERAAQDAYRLVGITNPRKELDVIELYEPCSFSEIHWCEYLGLCESGEGGNLMESGATSLDGEIPVNPSGGVMSANPIGATGMIRVAEASLQLQGKAGEHQIEGAKTSMATGFGGSAWNEVMILDTEK